MYKRQLKSQAESKEMLQAKEQLITELRSQVELQGKEAQLEVKKLQMCIRDRSRVPPIGTSRSLTSLTLMCTLPEGMSLLLSLIHI